jgi:hypothetical protein
MDLPSTSVGIGSSTTSWIRTTPSSSQFTGDDVIQAWEQGKKDGVDEILRLAVTQLDENVKAAFAHTSELLSIMQNLGVKPSNAWLKISTWNRLHVLVLVDERDMLEGGIYEVYKEIQSIEDRENTGHYSICFSLVGDAPDLNHRLMESDGYTRAINPGRLDAGTRSSQ